MAEETTIQTTSEATSGAAVEAVSDSQTHETPQQTVDYNEQISSAGPARKRITLDIPRESIETQFSNAFLEMQRDVQIPGFRKGRAPRRVIEKRFGQKVGESVRQELISEALSNIMSKHELVPIGEPEILSAPAELPETGPLHIEFEVDIFPEFSLPDLKALEIKRPLMEASDARLEMALDAIRQQFAVQSDVTENIAEGDLLQHRTRLLDEQGNVLYELNSPEVAAGAKWEVMNVEVPQLMQACIAASVGQTVTAEADFPADHPDEKLRGKHVRIEMHIEKATRKVVPEWDEKLLASVGFSNMEELRTEMRKEIATRLKQEQRHLMERQLFLHLLKNTSVELPAEAVQQHLSALWKRQVVGLLRRGVPQGQAIKMVQQNLAASVAQGAVDLKLFFILTKLAQEMEVSVTDAMANSALSEIAVTNGTRPERLRRQMEQSGQLEMLKLQIRDSLVASELLDDAKIVDTDEQTLVSELAALEEQAVDVTLASVSRERQGVHATEGATDAQPDAQEALAQGGSDAPASSADPDAT